MNLTKTGDFIKRKRKELGLTQKELAQILNCTDKAVSRWETGKGFPDVSMLEELSKALGVTVNELILGEDIPEEALTEKTDEVIVETIKTSNKKLSITKLLIVLLLILLGFLVIKQLSVVELVYSALKNPSITNQYSYFDNPQDAISERLDYLKDDINNENETVEIYEYKESLFKTEDEANYYEFFLAKDNRTVWYFIVKKELADNAIKYRTEHYENNVQYGYYEWKSINESLYYRFFEKYDDIENYNGIKPQVYEYESKTIQGTNTEYLAIVDKKETK